MLKCGLLRIQTFGTQSGFDFANSKNFYDYLRCFVRREFFFFSLDCVTTLSLSKRGNEGAMLLGGVNMLEAIFPYFKI